MLLVATISTPSMPCNAAAATASQQTCDVSMPDALQQFCLAGISNAMAACVTNPIDVIKVTLSASSPASIGAYRLNQLLRYVCKVRMQMDGEGAKAVRRFLSPLQCGRQLVADESVATLYRGLTASIIREVGAPSSTVPTRV